MSDELSYIVPELRQFAVPVDALVLDPHNARKHDERNLEAIANSMRSYKQRIPIVVQRSNNVVRSGNGRLIVAKRMGWTHIAAIIADDDDADAVAFAIADNRTAELASWDFPELAESLRILNEQDYNLDLVGFNQDEINAMLSLPVPDLDAVAAGADATSLSDEQAEGRRFLVYSKEAVVEAAFAWHRERGFPYSELPLHVCLQEINALAALQGDALINSTIAYRVGDTYHPHRFDAHATAKISPVQAFHDDRRLRRAMEFDLDNGRRLGLSYPGALMFVLSTQAASNFRPGFACWLYRRYCKLGATVLDTSAGYGGRLVGFIASRIGGRYIGIDPNPKSHEGNERMARELGYADAVELYCMPAEDVPVERLEGRCDFAFTSPPYFCKEVYSKDETQSMVRYKKAELWRTGFLEPLMRLQFAALRSGSVAIMNIADIKIGNKPYPLVQWTVDAAKLAGFEHTGNELFPLGGGCGYENESEPVLVFQKP